MRAETIAESISSSAAALSLAGVPRPVAEAEQILCHVLKKGRVPLYMNASRPLKEKESRSLQRILLRRTAGVPLQYLTGRAAFYTCELNADHRALIPRPDTETLIDVVLDLAARGTGFGRIADVGTGSGNIAIVLARHLPCSEVIATDISGETVALASENADLNGVRDRIRFLVAHLLEPLSARSFDLIVANLPYVPDGAWLALPSEVRDHEPPAALRGGADGLDLIRELVGSSRKVLRDNGVLALEFGDGQENRVSFLFDSYGYDSPEIYRDINGKPRVAVGFINRTKE